ncbi:MAG: LysR family transcriptional regulator [Paracoccaceae bacterium]|nr:LysR family transcriptional regulator [Paracoccaceae bacterium]
MYILSSKFGERPPDCDAPSCRKDGQICFVLLCEINQFHCSDIQTILDQLRQIAIFAKTVDHGSFRAAARALGISPSVVSHHIGQLEEQLGAALLYRSTRKLSLTEDGKRLYAQAQTMVEAAETGIQSVVDSGRQASGVLNVTLPAVLSQSALIDRIASFSITHPKAQLSLDFLDARREIIGSGIDIAIRMGWLKDNSLKARKLYDIHRILVASTDYLANRPRPTSPEDVADWDWLELAPVRLKPDFLGKNGGNIRLQPTPQLSVNDANALYRLARAGAGLAIVPDFLAEADIAAGVVEHVLPEWSRSLVGVYAVRPPNAPKQGLTAFFLDAIVG